MKAQKMHNDFTCMKYFVRIQHTSLILRFTKIYTNNLTEGPSVMVSTTLAKTIQKARKRYERINLSYVIPDFFG